MATRYPLSDHLGLEPVLLGNVYPKKYTDIIEEEHDKRFFINLNFIPELDKKGSPSDPGPYPWLTIRGSATIGRRLLALSTAAYCYDKMPDLYVAGAVGIADLNPFDPIDNVKWTGFGGVPHRKLDVRGSTSIGPLFWYIAGTTDPECSKDDNEIILGNAPALKVSTGYIEQVSDLSHDSADKLLILPTDNAPTIRIGRCQYAFGNQLKATDTDEHYDEHYKDEDKDGKPDEYVGTETGKGGDSQNWRRTLKKDRGSKGWLQYLLRDLGINNSTGPLEKNAFDRYGVQLSWGSSYSALQLIGRSSDTPDNNGGDKDTVLYWGSKHTDRFRIRFHGQRTATSGVRGRDLVVLYPYGVMKVRGAIISYKHHNASDRRYKQSIKPLVGALDKIMALCGVTYEWNPAAFPDENIDSGTQIGFIAQDIERVLPEVVSSDENGMKSVDYSRITSVLVEAMKEQQALIRRQNERIQKLENIVMKTARH